MVSVQLTDKAVSDGRSLVEKLDKRGVIVNSAFWLADPDSGAWQLLLGMPEAERAGPRKAYKLIQAALKRMDDTELTLDDVGILKANAPVLNLLRIAVHTGPRDLHTIRFSRNVINGTLIPDAVIYRLSGSKAK